MMVEAELDGPILVFRTPTTVTDSVIFDIVTITENPDDFPQTLFGRFDVTSVRVTIAGLGIVNELVVCPIRYFEANSPAERVGLTERVDLTQPTPAASVEVHGSPPSGTILDPDVIELPPPMFEAAGVWYPGDAL